MQKARNIIFIFMFTLILCTACKKEADPKETITEIPTPTITLEPLNDNDTPSSTPEIMQTPENLKSLHLLEDLKQKYEMIQNQYGFEYTGIDEVNWDPITNKYIFRLFDLEAEPQDREIDNIGYAHCIKIFTNNYNDDEYKNFELKFFQNDIEVTSLRDIVTATFLCINDSIDLRQAEQLRDKLFSSYSKELDRSDFVSCGNYKVALDIMDFDENPLGIIEVKDIKSLNKKIDTEEYDKLEYEQMFSNLYDDYRVQLKGVVLDTNYNNSDCLRIQDEQGREYTVIYNYFNFMCPFELGSTYHLYGSVIYEEDLEVPYLSLDYYELKETK